ncbi:type II toxin-antitoxin system RelE/ParE family toxin [Pseudobacter ginsenosidimutans]|uniref:Proteic killer suppression protein n=1 Tax=Pseudobacter ginsenosidimutans TaxID=661488 RepID=A0A4Q7N3U1_9BACT|nr:type II toxin-antitoxin system mRNA interferase toxin, RelE/StbE family [Pseudobacter ginsenosidimutans]RZS75646.1 proteic killer suppression protein [Pseudobacter ginsenosidimutans]
MIISITHKGLRQFWENDDPSLLPTAYIEKIRRILYLLNHQSPLRELQLLRRYRLHRLTGNLEDYWSLHITPNYRIIFRIVDDDVHLVNFLDYHNKKSKL